MRSCRLTKYLGNGSVCGEILLTRIYEHQFVLTTPNGLQSNHMVRPIYMGVVKGAHILLLKR